MQTLKQLQEIRTYYDFVSVDDDRYTIDGRYRQVNVAARELNSVSFTERGTVDRDVEPNWWPKRVVARRIERERTAPGRAAG